MDEREAEPVKDTVLPMKGAKDKVLCHRPSPLWTAPAVDLAQTCVRPERKLSEMQPADDEYVAAAAG